MTHIKNIGKLRKAIGISCLFFLFFFPQAEAQDLFDQNKIRDLHIYFYQEDWDTILDSYKIQGLNKRLLARLEVDNNVLDSIGIKFKGNSSYNPLYKKNPFNIKLDYQVKGQNLWGYKDFRLNNIFHDPSAIREVLAFNIIRQYTPAPQASFVNLYINDELTGLYVIVEEINKSFLKKNYAYDKGAFFKCEFQGAVTTTACKTQVLDGLTLGYTLDSNCYSKQYEKKSKYGWDQMLDLMQSIWYNNDTESTWHGSIENKINIECMIWTLAFNNLFVNLDSYNWSGRNYFLAQDTLGRFHIIPWDMNMCFGGFSHHYNSSELASFPVFASFDYEYRPLISRLVKTDYFQEYISCYSTLIKEQILSGAFEKEAKRLHKMVYEHIKNDPWFYYSDESFQQSLDQWYMNYIPGVIRLMDDRLEYLKTVPELEKAFR